MVGIVKDHRRKALHAAVEVGPTFWPYAAMHVADASRLWSQPAFGELVAVTRPGQKKALKSKDHAGYYLYSQSWTNRVMFVLVKDADGRRI
eukprot:8955335-Prorocentrum_lima.AAC.1